MQGGVSNILPPGCRRLTRGYANRSRDGGLQHYRSRLRLNCSNLDCPQPSPRHTTNLWQRTKPGGWMQDAHKDAGILRVSAYIEVGGNEKADRQAQYLSILGKSRSETKHTTEEGVRYRMRALRWEARTQQGFRK